MAIARGPSRIFRERDVVRWLPMESSTMMDSPRRLLPRLLTSLTAVLVLGAQPALAVGYSGPITVHPDNRRYFMFGNTCDAIYLAGTHHRANVQDVGSTTYPPPAFPFGSTYPPTDAPRANFIRGWHWEHSRWVVNGIPTDWIYPLPFARTGPGIAFDGKPKFNLDSYDGGYVTRLQNRATTAQNENMYISLMLFQGFSVQSLDPGENPELNHPFQTGNNTAGINGNWNAGIGGVAENHTILAGNPAALTTAQDNYVRNVVASLNGYKRLLWEVSNESNPQSLSWQNHVAGVIRTRETTLPNKHLVWISHPQGVTNVALFGSTADVISPSKNELAVTATGGTVSGLDYQNDPPATSGAKIVILDTDHLGATCDWCDAGWVWEAFTRGYHVALLDDLGTLNANQRQNVRRGINDTLGYAQKIRLREMAPQNESQSTPCSTRYCLYTSNDPDPLPYTPAVPNGHEYLVFKPNPVSNVTIFSLPAGTYSGEWLRVPTSAVQAVASFSHPGGNKTFTSPWPTNGAVLWIKDGSSSLCFR
jgi:hypothetical protein